MRLVAETGRPAPGSEVTIAFASVPQPGWHAYWKNGGDAGLETQLTWALPKGVTAGAMRYPVPGRLLISGLMNYVYEAPFATFVTLKIPPGPAAGSALPISVKVDYLVCTTTICVPGDADAFDHADRWGRRDRSCGTCAVRCVAAGVSKTA